MARYAYDVDTLTRYIDVHKQFSGGLKTVDTDDALGAVFLREAQNLSLSEFGFIEKRYGLIENLRHELSFVLLQGYFEYVEKDQSVTRIMIGKESNEAGTLSKIYFVDESNTATLITPELNPLAQYSENFKDFTESFEITHRDEIQGVRLGDVLYIFTGVYPLVYSGKEFDEEFTVTFDYGDGSTVSNITTTYPAFTNLNEADDYPPEPTDEELNSGYIRFGWVPSEIESLSENTTVTYQYIRDVKTVNFYLDEALTELYATRFVVLGGDADLPAEPTKEDEGFVGWVEAVEGQGLTNVQTDTDVYAEFLPYSFTATIQFENSSTTEVIPLANGQNLVYDIGAKFDEIFESSAPNAGVVTHLLDAVTEDGSAATGYDSNTRIFTRNENTASFTILVESTAKDTYEFRMRFSGTDLNENDVIITLYDGQNFNFTVPNFDKYDFDEVITTGGSTFDTDQSIVLTAVNQAYDLTAKYTEEVVINTYTVTFEDYDGTVLKTQTVQQGNDATAPSDPTRDGYTFTGWDTSFTNVQSNLTVTAQYTQNTETFDVTIIYDNWDGTELDRYTATKNQNSTVNVSDQYDGSAPTRSDPNGGTYTFTGWSPSTVTWDANKTVTTVAQFSYQAPPTPEYTIRVKLTMPTGTPYFRELQYSLDPGGSGTVNVTNTSYTVLTDSAVEDTHLLIQTDLNIGSYTFDHWEINGVNVASSTSLDTFNINDGIKEDWDVEAVYVSGQAI